MMAVIVPIATGVILGPTGVVGLLAGVSVAGFAVSVFMSNAGGAWDNAKKYIEEGHFGGKGSKPHKGIDNAADGGGLSAENVGNKVESEKTHKTPVEAADDAENKGDAI